MAEITEEQRMVELEFANLLTLFAAKAPSASTEREVVVLARSLSKRFSFSPRLKKLALLNRLLAQPMSAGELIEETGYRREDVYALLNELESESKIKLEKIPPAGPQGGRPRILYAAVIANMQIR
jgi:predicted Rossmann fold nucleotide-binding protein DprA/Smf involved in DNA uptake